MELNDINGEEEAVHAAVIDLLVEAGECDVHPSLTTSLSSLGMDSLKLIEIIFALETRFAVVADEQQMVELDTVGDLVVMIRQACEAQQEQGV